MPAKWTELFEPHNLAVELPLVQFGSQTASQTLPGEWCPFSSQLRIHFAVLASFLPRYRSFIAVKRKTQAAQTTRGTEAKNMMAFLQAPSPSTRRRAVAKVAISMNAPPTQAPQPPSAAKLFSRRVVLAALASAAGSLVAAEVSTAAAPSKLEYTVVKQGDGPSAVIGDLVGIRFKGVYNGVVFDNLFDEPRPYFFRAGSGTILQGLEEAILLMKVGDVYDLILPGDLAFGAKGRRASAGKPSIPPNATVNYTLELTTIPGKEKELLESLDDVE